MQRNRIVLALDLGDHGLPADDVARVLQRVGATGEWYLARDPSLQIAELLQEDGELLRVGRQGGGYRVTLELTPPVTEWGETVEEALHAVYNKARREGAIQGDE